ncbi:MAG: DUF3015 domain-containing protein [Proteobacteria bacterium]|nr:MAG: DUF3015 domain-containing protein [Pseudomonadota bacterium]
MRLASVLVAVSLSFAASQAMAADGSSGCGPAWYVFKNNSLLSSFARVITNGILSPVVTIGMSFGTSNCAKHSLVMNDQGSLEFAAKSMDILRQDMAKGEGEHLTAYLASFGCNELVRPELAIAMQQAFTDDLYRSEDPIDYVASTRALINFKGRQGMCS